MWYNMHVTSNILVNFDLSLFGKELVLLTAGRDDMLHVGI
jgi:hypothetical protein